MRTLPFRTSIGFLLLVALLAPAMTQASELNIPPEAEQGIHVMFAGHPQQAIATFRKIQEERPEHPLGYLLEAEAIWWQLYCGSMERKYDTVDAWEHTPGPEDDAYFALADKVIRLSEGSIRSRDTAEMELYAGMGYMLRTRLTGLRGQRLATAHGGVEGRKHLLRCIELDPNMADAYFGLGLYNYYVDTLSSMAKMLRFFMGIPGGNKHTGLRQLNIAIEKAELTQVDARFYTAKSLRSYDQEYGQAAELAAPLVMQFPENSVFLLVTGDLDAKLNHNQQAALRFHAAQAAPEDNSACAERVRLVASQALAALNK